MFLLSLTFPGISQKKDTVLIRPGSSDLKSTRLQNYTSSYDMFSYKDGEEKLVGSLEDHFSINKKAKQGLRVCKITFGANNILDSGLCILKGLTPIYHRSMQTKKNIDLRFNKEQVSGKIISKTDADPKVEVIDHKTPSPLFDSFYEDIIAKSVDLKNGVLFRFPEYIYERGGTVWSLGEISKSDNAAERVIKFYELNPKKEIVRTTTYVVNESTHEILRREYLIGSNKIVMRKRQS